MQQLHFYTSSIDEYSDEENDANRNPKPRIMKSWIKVVSFETAKEAEDSIENVWSKLHMNHTDDGQKVYFRCNKVKRRGTQCSASIHLLYHCDSDKVTVYKTNTDHDKCLTAENMPGIDSEVKRLIKNLFNDGIKKPKQILRALQSKTSKMPTVSQLGNYLSQMKKKKYGENTISLGELNEWCIKNSSIPVNDDTPFVVSYNINYADEVNEDDDMITCNNFRIFLSTKRLLTLAQESTHLHADATYKLIWQGFPVLVVGTTDMDKCFHPFGLAICTNEKTNDFQFMFQSIQKGLEKLDLQPIQPMALVSDASDAIKSGFKKVFGEKDIVMCWAHMKRNVENRVCHVDDKTIRRELIEDIESLQLTSSKEMFQIASILFLQKWRHKQKNQTVLDFILYFENEWLISNNGWFEGIQLFIPSNNNGLEATNKVIKDDGTFRERHVLSRFLVVAKNIVCDWSVGRDLSIPNAKIFAKKPTLNLKLWTSAYQLAKQHKNIIFVENDNLIKYYVPTCGFDSISNSDLDKFVNKTWKSFNQFKKCFNFCCVEFVESAWLTSRCNCPAFLKSFICKHVVCIALRLKLCKAPPAAKNVPIGEKRKRGRPSKAKRAFLVQ